MTFQLRKFSLVTAYSATLLAVTASPVLKANAQQPGNVYPNEIVQQFVSSCSSSAIGSGLPENLAQNTCQCMIGELQKRYSLEEFAALPQQVQQNQQAAATLARIAQSCAPQLPGN